MDLTLVFWDEIVKLGDDAHYAWRKDKAVASGQNYIYFYKFVTTVSANAIRDLF